MSQQGIQAISQRAAVEPRFRRQLRQRPLRALEGYDLTLNEHKTLEALAGNGWLLPGEKVPHIADDANKGCGCLASLVTAVRQMLTD